jgi:hypothetical protein
MLCDHFARPRAIKDLLTREAVARRGVSFTGSISFDTLSNKRHMLRCFVHELQAAGSKRTSNGVGDPALYHISSPRSRQANNNDPHVYLHKADYASRTIFRRRV